MLCCTGVDFGSLGEGMHEDDEVGGIQTLAIRTIWAWRPRLLFDKGILSFILRNFPNHKWIKSNRLTKIT